MLKTSLVVSAMPLQFICPNLDSIAKRGAAEKRRVTSQAIKAGVQTNSCRIDAQTSSKRAILAHGRFKQRHLSTGYGRRIGRSGVGQRHASDLYRRRKRRSGVG